MTAALAATPTTVAPVAAPAAPTASAPVAIAVESATASPLPAPIVISDAGNSMLYDAEPALRLALGTPFHNHTIGGFGLSVMPEVWQGVFGRDVPGDHPAVVVVMLGNRDFPVALAPSTDVASYLMPMMYDPAATLLNVTV